MGDHGPIHDARSEYSSYELPVVIEIVDEPARIAVLLLPVLEAMVDGGLILVQDVQVLRYELHADSGNVPAG